MSAMFAVSTYKAERQASGKPMTYSVEGYVRRAEECVRLANATDDQMLRGAILRLRQDYLSVAGRLATQDERPPICSGDGRRHG